MKGHQVLVEGFGEDTVGIVGMHWGCSDYNTYSMYSGFPIQKMEYPDPTLTILPSSNILVSLRGATLMLKCVNSLQMRTVLCSGLAPS